MNRKFKTHHATRTVALAALALSLAACTTVFESDKVDYRSAKKAAPLDIPPDLTQLQKDNRYAVPDGRGVATASGFQQARGTQAAPAAAGGPVAPVSSEAVRIERAGDSRWLVVKEPPEQLWPQLQAFWPSVGFTVETENPQTGIMETNWSENRAKIPQDIIRRTIGKVFDSAYDSGQRDKFRTRLERRADGSTEIYISHRGAEEVLVGPQRETTQWVGRKSDPELEAEFLGRLMAQLNGSTSAKDVKQATAAVVNAAPEVQHAKLENGKVVVDEGFDRAWRRVGLALDRVGFTVEDRDRVQGIYFVRYVDPDAVNKAGFFSKLFGSDDKNKEAQRYRVLVSAVPNATTSDVSVQTNDGKPETSATGAKILKLLADELK
ncbi:outer membrane protein assembly factor BamC [Massilia sp. WF1]|uniref:outer membrane protein assembly factor BamC n=1 Tax=unclassified Massilia TaxID=2609279 RepID=UPI000D68A0D4